MQARVRNLDFTLKQKKGAEGFERYYHDRLLGTEWPCVHEDWRVDNAATDSINSILSK